MEISKELCIAIERVWYDIADDICGDYGEEPDNVTAIELALDADRLETFGFKKEAEEWSALASNLDLDLSEIYAEIAKKVQLSF